MRPLTSASSATLLKRIDNATGGELRSLVMSSPTTCTLTLSVQDRNRGFDWINIVFEVSGLSDARMLDDNKLAFVDMSDGITIVFDKERAGLGIGTYNSIDALRSSTLYLIGNSIKYAEADFSD